MNYFHREQGNVLPIIDRIDSRIDSRVVQFNVMKSNFPIVT
jgi:hypothetical protein